MARLVLVVCVAVAASTLAAGANAQTRKQWARSADAVCAKGLAKVRRVVGDMQAHPPRTVRRWVAGYDKTIAAFRGVYRGLAALPRPPRDRARIGTLVSTLGRLLVEMRQVRRDTLARDRAAVRRDLVRTSRLGSRFDRLAAALGANVCANG